MSAAEDKQNLLDIATRAFGDATDAIDDFVSKGMQSLGYRPRTEWDDPEPPPPDPNANRRGGSGFTFDRPAPSGAPGRTRDVGGGGRPPARTGDYSG